MKSRSIQRLLVTGGAGFIGSAFIRYLLSNEVDFHGLCLNFDLLTYAGNVENLAPVASDPRYLFEQGDIHHEKHLAHLIEEHAIDSIIHFAAETHVDRSIANPKAFVEANIQGTFHLLEVVRKYPHLHFHHVSTDEVYGSLGKTGTFTEESPYRPNSPYSASKASSDHFVRAYHDTYKLPCVISNCSNNYGPFHFPEKLIPLCINNIKNNKLLPIYGKGENVRDWLFVEDHARAIDVIFHTAALGSTYNIGGHNEWTNIDVIKLLCRIMDKKLNREAGTNEKLITFVTDRAGHDLRYAIDATKLKNDLGWVPSVTFEQGLDLTVDWYLSNQEWLNNVTSGNYAKYYEQQYSKA